MFEIVSAYSRKDELRRLFKEYTDFLIDSDKKFAYYLELQNYDDELINLEAKYGEPNGRLYLGLEDSKAVACVAMKQHDGENAGELKRLYVMPEYRGRGYARALSERILSDARDCGYDAVYLDTLPALKAAQALYADMGFELCPPYNDDPMGYSIFMRKDLTDD